MNSSNRTLTDWVDYIQTLHAREIDLALDRVGQVHERLQPDGAPFRSIVVAGTNGKGSTSELLASIYRAAGYRVGKYTSPHLVSFAERFNLLGEIATETDLLKSFERVEAARRTVRLTFFEFGTLVALDLFAQAGVELAIMEVGLGGRLDAVNILEPEISVITNIALDHTAWLGDSLAEIAREKFGVTRAGKTCVLGMRSPPTTLIELAHSKGVKILQAGKEFSVQIDQCKTSWGFEGQSNSYMNLPLPFSQLGHQIDNAATALATIEELAALFTVPYDSICQGLKMAIAPGRCQVIQRRPLIVLDVAHNEASVAALVQFLATLKVDGKVVAVCGMLQDKKILAALTAIKDRIDAWHFATIDDPRGASATQMARLLREIQSDSVLPCLIEEHDQAVEAFEHAKSSLNNEDCLLVFGSFFITGDIIDHLSSV